MTRPSIVELSAAVDTAFPDNTSGLITPAILRAFLHDFLNAVRPAYGIVTLPASNIQTLGLTPQVIVFTEASDSSAAETVSTAATGSVARTAKGTSTINFSMDIEAANGRFVTFTIYKNGAPTLWRITGNGGGAGNPVSVALTAIDYADPAATYQIFATAEIDGVSTTLSNGALLVSADPVNSYA